MDNAEYRAIYKCRLCGEEFEDCVTGEELAQVINIALVVLGHTQHVKIQRNLYQHATHFCKDGSFGFADFQGFKKFEDNAKYYSEQQKVAKSYVAGETE